VIEPVDVQQIAEEYPNSRFKITNVPILKPGVCFICGDSGGTDFRQFVDFGKTVDFYGVVYVCTFCIAEIAQLLGFTNNNKQIVAAHNEIAERYNELLTKSMEMENDFRRILRNCNCEPVISGESVALVDVEANSDADEAESDADEYGDVEESGDVSEPSGDDDAPTPKRRPRTSKSAE
jgi:hypothetical protein